MATKNIKERTKKNYIRMWDYRIRNTLGNIRVVDFKTSHVRTFFSALSDEGLAHSTIKGLYGLLNPSFELAVEDGIIRKNPVTGTLGDYGAPAKEKEALTLEQQEKLLKFVEQSNVYKPHLPICLLYTSFQAGLDLNNNTVYQDFVKYHADAAFWAMVRQGCGFRCV